MTSAPGIKVSDLVYNLKVLYVPLNIQADGRINLGTKAHLTPKCHTLGERLTQEVRGRIIYNLPLCQICRKEYDAGRLQLNRA